MRDRREKRLPILGRNVQDPAGTPPLALVAVAAAVAYVAHVEVGTVGPGPAADTDADDDAAEAISGDITTRDRGGGWGSSARLGTWYVS